MNTIAETLIAEGMERGMERGIRDSISTGLQVKFGVASEGLALEVEAVNDLDRLRAVQRALYTAATPDEILAELRS